jgi:uncharacterized protein
LHAFLEQWGEAARVSLGFFWMALWAFVLGYLVSACIQVFVTRERMRRALGDAGPSSVALASFFGLISSSCSFAALATAKSLFQKGAGLVPSLAFLLASTNLVVELGIVIAVFLAWPFVLGEYLGGLLLIGIMWAFVTLTRPRRLVAEARERLADDADDTAEIPDWRRLIRSREGWARVGARYAAEWRMVWKDVTFGFAVAGIIAAFVPPAFFGMLFVGSGGPAEPSGWAILEQVLVGPLAAFLTFIGSMGNVPLAALLFANGVSFAGVMAFLFSDLVVFPVLRIHARYYGWRMALYLLATLLVALVGASLLLHTGFALLDWLPEVQATRAGVRERTFFAWDHTLALDLAALALTGLLLWLARSGQGSGPSMAMAQKGVTESVLFWLALASLVWLAGGVVVWLGGSLS